MEMTYLDQVLWVVFGAPEVEQATDQADAVWQTIEDECRRMREAGIAD